ncbi:helix-turn-helix domain-containing protein [Saccharothrix syringae]|uniref:Winged helix-turn-helix domain-containing protein n=1 Tax=Saccharothrix syringae TaxID=103733 RepID=A0A5Q0H318_SACSY|nr:winged helix-turn-helix domain-containing protein [Saccharothrix syringae]
MTEPGVGLWLRRHGFTPQRPARRVHERQPAAMRLLTRLLAHPSLVSRLGPACRCRWDPTSRCDSNGAYELGSAGDSRAMPTR